MPSSVVHAERVYALLWYCALLTCKQGVGFALCKALQGTWRELDQLPAAGGGGGSGVVFKNPAHLKGSASCFLSCVCTTREQGMGCVMPAAYHSLVDVELVCSDDDGRPAGGGVHDTGLG